MRVCIIDNNKKLADFSVDHIPRIGETIYFGEAKFEVTEVIHQFAPHDINVKIKKS